MKNVNILRGSGAEHSERIVVAPPLTGDERQEGAAGGGAADVGVVEGGLHLSRGYHQPHARPYRLV